VFIEFIKSLLLTPFVLHTRPNASREQYISKTDSMNKSSLNLVPIEKTTSRKSSTEAIEEEFQFVRDTNINRYCEILACIEDLILDHILHDHNGVPEISRLSQLVPSIGSFFVRIPL
jgi:IMP and pyridine-specific 5'-nucleotidase